MTHQNFISKEHLSLLPSCLPFVTSLWSWLPRTFTLSNSRVFSILSCPHFYHAYDHGSPRTSTLSNFRVFCVHPSSLFVPNHYFFPVFVHHYTPFFNMPCECYVFQSVVLHNVCQKYNFLIWGMNILLDIIFFWTSSLVTWYAYGILSICLERVGHIWMLNNGACNLYEHQANLIVYRQNILKAFYELIYSENTMARTY